MPVDLERMQRRLAALTTPELGGTPAGGMSRLALSDADRAARDLFAGWLRDLGLAVRVDDFGNIYGRRAGTDPNAAQPSGVPRWTGSRLSIGTRPRCRSTSTNATSPIQLAA